MENISPRISSVFLGYYGDVRRGRTRLYDWDRWFAGPGFTLRRGVDYQCSTISMAQQIRSKASEYPLSVTVRETSVGLVVTVWREEIGAKAG